MALDPMQQCSVCPSLSIKRLGVVKRLKRDGDGKGRGNMALLENQDLDLCHSHLPVCLA